MEPEVGAVQSRPEQSREDHRLLAGKSTLSRMELAARLEQNLTPDSWMKALASSDSWNSDELHLSRWVARMSAWHNGPKLLRNGNGGWRVAVLAFASRKRLRHQVRILYISPSGGGAYADGMAAIIDRARSPGTVVDYVSMPDDRPTHLEYHSYEANIVRDLVHIAFRLERALRRDHQRWLLRHRVARNA